LKEKSALGCGREGVVIANLMLDLKSLKPATLFNEFDVGFLIPCTNLALNTNSPL
jgi:hypothetical protein